MLAKLFFKHSRYRDPFLLYTSQRGVLSDLDTVVLRGMDLNGFDSWMNATHASRGLFPSHIFILNALNAAIRSRIHGDQKQAPSCSGSWMCVCWLERVKLLGKKVAG